MMVIEDEHAEELELFYSIYDVLVSKKSLPPQDNNFDSEEMEHCLQSIYKNHRWFIRYPTNDQIDIIGNKYTSF
jgi:hypothetical protein